MSKIIFTSITIFLLLICSFSNAYAQCPEGSKPYIINTQEKHDYFFENFPNCTDFGIIMYNGKYIGDPKTKNYIIILMLSVGFMLIVLKVLFTILDNKYRPSIAN